MGDDYDTPSGGNVFPVTIPAGNYNSAQIPLGITINDDSSLEGSENIQLTISSNPLLYTITSTSVCGGSPVSVFEHVIMDNDMDISISKSNNTDAVYKGDISAYSLTVFNNGGQAATGVIVRDTPVSGLICQASDPVNISGSGVPVGSFTIGDLVGPGIVLGTLQPGESATLTIECEVG